MLNTRILGLERSAEHEYDLVPMFLGLERSAEHEYDLVPMYLGLERSAEHEYDHHILSLHWCWLLRLPQIRHDTESLLIKIIKWRTLVLKKAFALIF